MQFFFLPWTSKKCPWTISQKCPWTFCFCPWTLEKILPVNPKNAREQSKKCPWNSILPVNIFKKKCPWTYENCPWTSKFCVFLLLFVKNCPWTAKSARENFQKSARERTLKCPWKRLKKCPWTHPLTREFSPKSAREPKKVPVNIVQKMGFTGTFDVHGEKKHWIRPCNSTTISNCSFHNSGSKRICF